MARLRLSVAARRDLEDIQAASLSEHGLVMAREHMAGFARLFALLREHPLAGPARPDYGADIRLLLHRPHRILYRADHDLVLIVRILHHARDASNALGKTSK